MTRIQQIIHTARDAGEYERLNRVLMLVEEYGMEVILAIMLKQMFNFSCDGEHENNIIFIKTLAYQDQILLIEALEAAFLGIEHSESTVLH